MQLGDGIKSHGNVCKFYQPYWTFWLPPIFYLSPASANKKSFHRVEFETHLLIWTDVSINIYLARISVCKLYHGHKKETPTFASHYDTIEKIIASMVEMS